MNEQSIHAYLQGEMDAEEQAAFELACKDDPSLEAALRAAIRADIAIISDAQASLLADLNQQYDHIKRNKQKARRLWGIGATIAAAILLFFLVQNLSQPASMGALYEQYAAAAPVPEQKSIMQDSIWQEAVQAYKIHDYQLAGQYFQQLSQDSSFAQQSFAALYAGHSYGQTDRVQLAIDLYQQAVDHVETANWHIALLYLKIEDKERAVEAFSQAAQSSFYAEKAQQILSQLE